MRTENKLLTYSTATGDGPLSKEVMENLRSPVGATGEGRSCMPIVEISRELAKSSKVSALVCLLYHATVY
jgi:hypothetical protein